MARFQNGWLQKKPRKAGEIWVFCHRRRRHEDGAWIQATDIPIGRVRDYPSEEAAWRRVEELHLDPNRSPIAMSAQVLFGELAAHYIQRELPDDQSEATIEKAYSTIQKIQTLSQPLGTATLERHAGVGAPSTRGRRLVQRS